MATKKTKAATKGAKQIVEENKTTLSFYRNMIVGALGIYFTVTMLFSNITTLSITLSIFFGIIYIGSYQFMKYIAQASYSESGQLLDSGIDLNMEGGIADHVKDLIILTSGVHVLSLISNYFWLLWLLAPLRGGHIIWKQILAPWFFAPAPEQPEMSEKKQRKLEKRMARRH
ncbi:PREDICTED: transmembrane protein 208 [Dufourea novaeangliae]|uniref:transmembrane protein 208 n=1 Tax=Dufourea novaeangliae TaxID=178035 RepID=UPI0007670101|nr:PREDICTED: transmembrane protein 208 [Dufourea novaeangliae]